MQIATAGSRGPVVLAARRFQLHERVLAFSGPMIPLARVTDFSRCIEVAPGRFLGSSGGPDDLVAHSCSPNTAVVLRGDEVFLQALGPIAVGDEITYDYSTAMLTDPSSVKCRCGAAECRGVVTAFGQLPHELRRRLICRGMVPAFVVIGAPTPPSR